MESWKSWPSMAAYVEGNPMRTASGAWAAPNSTSTLNNLTALAHWFDVIRPQCTLEIGLAFGASATLFCELHRKQGQAGRHHAVDPFQVQHWGDAARLHLQEQKLDPWFEFHLDFSSQTLPKLLAEKQQFGMIYVDGSHLFEDVLVDFYFAHQLVSLGGMLAFDDSGDPHVRKVIRFIRRNFASIYEEHSPYAITRPSSGPGFRLAARLLHRQQLPLFRKKKDGSRDWNTPFRDF